MPKIATFLWYGHIMWLWCEDTIYGVVSNACMCRCWCRVATWYTHNTSHYNQILATSLMCFALHLQLPSLFPQSLLSSAREKKPRGRYARLDEELERSNQDYIDQQRHQQQVSSRTVTQYLRWIKESESWWPLELWLELPGNYSPPYPPLTHTNTNTLTIIVTLSHKYTHTLPPSQHTVDSATARWPVG